MKLKKILAVISAAALMGALSLPVFAEATPGQASNDKLVMVTNKPNATKQEVSEAVAEVTSLLNQSTDKEMSVSGNAVEQGLRYFDMEEEDGGENMKRDTVQGVVYRCDNDATVNVSSCDFLHETGEIKVEATASGTSGHGYSLTIKLDPNSDVKEYRVIETSNMLSFEQPVQVDGYMTKNGYEKSVTIWVPHFTTFVLQPVNESGSTGGGEQGGQTSGNNNTNTNTTTSNSNTQTVTSSQSTSTQNTSAATSSVEAENPIKATGSDMNLTVFVVVALAVAAACGLGVVSKKSRKSE